MLFIKNKGWTNSSIKDKLRNVIVTLRDQDFAAKAIKAAHIRAEKNL